MALKSAAGMKCCSKRATKLKQANYAKAKKAADMASQGGAVKKASARKASAKKAAPRKARPCKICAKK